MTSAAVRAVERLAVLLAAGIPPAAAWRYTAEGDDGLTAMRDVVSAGDVLERLPTIVDGAPPSERSGWCALAGVWRVATESGAALSSTLERLADVLRDLDRAAREVDVAIAGPRATSRVMLVLPAVGLALGFLLGFDVLGAFATIPGAACLVLGLLLIVIGLRWSSRLVARARRHDATAGLALDLLAVALAGGVAVDRARAVVADACEEAELGLDLTEGDAVIGFATRAGVPAVALLRAEADGRRRDARDAAARAAVELETRLLLPLGICVLPAFVLLGVAPIGIAVISSTVSGLL